MGPGKHEHLCRSRSESGGQVAALEGESPQSAAAFAGGGEAVAFSGSGWVLLGGLARECHHGVCS